jgi:3-dehydroquinate dehydratase-2
VLTLGLCDDAESRVANAPKVLILNGPNLNLLGTREPETYGAATLTDIEESCRDRAAALGLETDCRQSNSEGELVGWIQQARGTAGGIIINPGAYTHTSVAILDALLAAGLPVIEVHLSNIHRREDFRRHSYVSQAAEGVICGLGARGYLLALEAMAGRLAEKRGC